MKCQKCGMPLPEGSEFCQYCGVKLDLVSIAAETVDSSISTNSVLETEAPAIHGQIPSSNAESLQYDILFEDEPNKICAGIPVLIEKVILLKDPQTDSLSAKCRFKCLTDKPLLAMLVDVHCTDIWGSPTASVEGFQFLDLKTKRDTSFGQDTLIPISDAATRFLTLKIKKIIYSDRTLTESGQEEIVLPGQQTLVAFFGSDELADEFIREAGINAQYTISEGGGYWLCTCGAINAEAETNCYRCNANKVDLLTLQNVDLISARLDAYRKEMQEKAEQERAERERYLRQAEEKARMEKEEAERKSREEAARTADETRKKKELHKKKVKRIGVIAAAILLVILSAYALIWHIIPSIHYNSAEKALKNQEYDDAYEKFLALEDYKDSKERANEAVYQKGCSLMNAGSYLDGAEVFEKIPNYKDSTEQATFCRNQDAYLRATELFESEHYSDASSAFHAISGFSDSAEMEKESTYLYAIQLLNSGEYEAARDAFYSIKDYEDSATLAEESYYQLALQYMEAKVYEKAHSAFKIIYSYKDSADLYNESYYRLATDLFNEKKYAEAAIYFNKITSTYKDSQDMAKEAKYCEATEYIEKKKYKQAIFALNSIFDYKDAEALLKEAKYKYAKQLANEGSFLDAMTLFESLGDYSDSASKYKETKYQYGEALISMYLYKGAVSIFEELGNYKDSKDKVKEAKYEYVLAHKNNTDTITFAYLKDLKASGYKDSKEIYKSLYAWKVINIYFNSSESGTNKKYNISKYDPVYCHFELSGGPPGESIYVYRYVIFPDGSTYSKKKTSSKYYRGSTGWWGWSDGIYTTPYYGETGTLTMKFYDEDGNLIGEGSVAITN